MAYISQWLSEQLQAKQADLIVEDTLWDVKRRSGLLEPFCPFKTFDGRKFLSYVVKEVNTVASVIAYGAEPPVASQGTFQKITAEMVKTGLTYRFDEETQWDMKEAMEYASAKGITVQDTLLSDGTVVKGANNTLANYIFGTIERMVRAQIDLLDALTWQVLQSGRLQWSDTRTGTNLDIVYTPTDTAYINKHFKTVTPIWSDYTNANGIQDLYNAIDDFIDENGYPPSAIVMSRKLRNHLMQQTSTKNAASSLVVTQVGTVSPEMLNAVLEARGIPKIITYDERYEREDSSKVVSNARFLNDDRFVLLTENMGIRAMGTTIESGDNQPGVYVVSRQISEFPPVDAIQGVATVLPVFTQPKLLWSHKVL